MVALWAIVLLAAYLQRQAGLSTVGEAHLLAVDWLGWICYLFDKLEVINLQFYSIAHLLALRTRNIPRSKSSVNSDL